MLPNNDDDVSSIAVLVSRNISTTDLQWEMRVLQGRGGLVTNRWALLIPDQYVVLSFCMILEEVCLLL